MVNFHHGQPNMDWLLNYEICASKRYRRSVSLVVFACDDEHTDQMNRYLRDFIRESDIAYTMGPRTLLVMGETSKEDAQIAIQRFREFSQEMMDIRYGVSSFPGDGKCIKDLVNKAHRRYDMARSLEWGACVDYD